MNSNNENPNLIKYTNKVVKYVSENEAQRYSIVYPQNIVNSLLIEQPTFDNSKRKYKVTMKPLHPFPSGRRLTTHVSSGAFRMLSEQLNRLHKVGMTHSNLNAAESRLKKPGGKVDVFAPLKRQLLVEYNGNIISKIYLTNFNRRKTANTINNEKTYVNQFKRFYNKNDSVLSNITLMTQNNNLPTPKKGRILF